MQSFVFRFAFLIAIVFHANSHSLAQNESASTEGCSVKAFSPEPSSYYSEIIVNCDGIKKVIPGYNFVWKDRNTLIFQKFVKGNLSILSEMALPSMQVTDLSKNAQKISHNPLSIEKGILHFQVEVPTSTEVHLEDHNLNLSTHTETVERKVESDVEVSDFETLNESGARIPLNIVRSKNVTVPKGLILFVHGGSASPGGEAPRGIKSELSPVAKKLLESGYYIINVTYSGDTIQSEGNYLKLRNNEDRSPDDYYRGELLDLLATEKFVKQKFPGVKFGYHGVSHGALLVNLLAGKYSERSHASAIFSDSGIWDIPTASNDGGGNEKMSWYLQPDNPAPQVNWNDYRKQWEISNPNIVGEGLARQELKQRMAAGEKEFVVFYTPSIPKFNDRNPSRYLERIKQPMLIRHGQKDLAVPIKQHNKLVSDLKLHPNPQIQILNSNGGHGMDEEEPSDLQTYFNFLSKNVAPIKP